MRFIETEREVVMCAVPSGAAEPTLPDCAAIDTAAIVAAFETSPNGVLLLDSRDAVIAANGQFARLWGLPEAAVIPGTSGLLNLLAAHAADPAGFAARLRNLERRELHEEIGLADGRVFEVETAAIRAADGVACGRAWYCRDVTPQQLAEARWRDAEAKFRCVVEQDVAGICIVDDRSCIAYANTTYARHFGYLPEQLIGRALAHILPPNERAPVAALLAAQFAGDRQVVRIPSTVQAKDGRIVDILVHATGVTYRGRPASVAVVTDVSELQEAKRALENADIIVAQSPVVLFRLLARDDFPTTYVSRNAARFGVAGDLAQLGVFDLVERLHPSDRPQLLAGLRAMVTGTMDNWSMDCRLLAGDGAVHWVHASGAPIRDADGAVTAVQGTLIDITERKQAEQSLERLNRALRTLSAGNEVVVRATSEQQLLDDMCQVLVDVGRYPRCWIGFASRLEPGAIQVKAACGCDLAMIASMAKPAPAEALLRMQPVILAGGAPCGCPGLTARAALPFRVGLETLGVLVLCAQNEDAFDADALKLLSELASDLAFGLLSLRAHAARDTGEQRLRDSMVATVQALVSTLEMRDPYTAGHQRRVAMLAGAIARRLGIDAEAIQGIELAAVVHDVGKVQVPAEILTKPGRLTTLEYQLVQVHAQAGYDILKGIDFPWPVALMVGQHHERIDGSGYPNHLCGDAILLGARIIAVADVVETMMSHRPYRPALGLDAALMEVAAGRGRLFEADAVDACIGLFREDGFSFA